MKSLIISIIWFYLLHIVATQISNECALCIDIAIRAKKAGTDSESVTKAKALQGAKAYDGQQQQDYINELNCHWNKYYGDANYRSLATPISTCADTGFCPLTNQVTPYTTIDITNTTTNYGIQCVVPTIILIHHTVTATIDDTLTTLNSRGLSVQYIVGKNGTIWQMVYDHRRAFHAGNGRWREIHDVNTYSIGIEIVNTGSEPFTEEQIQSVELLVATLRDRWFINHSYIIGHMEIRPNGKDDPSGYFPWQRLNAYLNILPGLFNSQLTSEQQHQVLISNGSWVESTLNRVQDGLLQYGYGYLSMTNGVLDDNMRYNIQSFNRHFCPEVFVKEVEDIQTQANIPNGLNQEWYALSDERLNFLLSTM